MNAQQAVDEWSEAGQVLELVGHQIFVRDVLATNDAGLEPLLVLHGFPSCSFDWRHVLPALSAQRRVVLFDFLGFGLSAKPNIRYSIEMQADITEAVVAHLDISQLALLTHDMGDSVGGEVLARSIDGNGDFEVTCRVITNGSIYLDLAQLTVGQNMLLSLPDEPLDLGDDGNAFRNGLAATFSPGHPASEAELAAQWQLQLHNGGQGLLPRTIRYIEDRRARESRYTGAIETHPSPLGVLWGKLDPIALHAMAERLLSARPDATLITLDDVAHYPMIEAPERSAEAIVSLLD